ncbi:MAG: 3-deoxy-manno-octulosonate cytidylyltransferase [Burkholderiales bacterium]|nr:3-deoxy-manno-octulosonate cytidylyltransferase [Burkholderiales bacterium]
MSFVAVVPARYASTRFPGKPLIDLDGKAMVVRVAEQAALSGAREVVVATDDDRIRDVCIAAAVRVVMTRSDHATGTDRLSEVATLLQLADDDVVVNVQGDEPEIPPTAIDRVADVLRADSEAAVATLCHAIHDVADARNPNVVKCVIGEDGRALYFSRAPIPFARDAWQHGEVADLPAGLPLYRHIGLYAYRASFLRAFPNLSVPTIERFESLEQLRALAHGYRIAVAIVKEPLPPGIDTPQDYARLLASR